MNNCFGTADSRARLTNPRVFSRENLNGDSTGSNRLLQLTREVHVGEEYISRQLN